MRKLLHDWLTESNGTSFCPWNFCGMVVIMAMTYKFCTLDKPDATVFFQFGAAVGGVILAIAGKRMSEHSEG